MNSVNIIGRLVKDPDIKKTDSGLSICDLRLAVDDIRSKEDRTDFFNVTVFGGQADLCERYLKKGFMTGVSGRIRSDVYTDSTGAKRYPIKLVAENVQFLQWPRRDEQAPAAKEEDVIETILSEKEEEIAEAIFAKDDDAAKAEEAAEAF